MANPDAVDPKTESSAALPNGKVVFPAYPAECSYVRVLDEQDKEIGYWDVNEWIDEPEEVMGAIMGAIKRAAEGKQAHQDWMNNKPAARS